MKNVKEVKDMTGPELVSYYNELATLLNISTTKRFSTRPAGISRVLALLDQYAEKLHKEEQAKKVDGRKKPNGPVATCRYIFDKLHGVGYTRIQFMKDCLEAGVPKSTSGKLWIPFGGARKAAK